MLRITNLEKVYGSGAGAVVALGGIDLEVADGELVCVVGPSGCGKTTLLRCIAGLLPPTRGEVFVDDVRVTKPHPAMAVVFQEYGRSLYPWLTVQQNVTLPLRARKLPNREAATRTSEALASVGLADAAKRHPWQLSGGMQQRVAIARALACRPKILLMDEPFASVDAQTREDLEDLVLDLRDRYEMDVLFITHDIDEAVYLADRVVVLSGSPTTVKHSYRVQLPSPRTQLETKSLSAFRELRTEVYAALRGVPDAPNQNQQQAPQAPSAAQARG